MTELLSGVFAILGLVIQAIMSAVVMVLAVLFRLLRLRIDSSSRKDNGNVRGNALAAGVTVLLLTLVAGGLGLYIGETWYAAGRTAGFGALLSVIGALKSLSL